MPPKARHGRNGLLMVDISPAADSAPVALPLMASWNVDGTRDRDEVTAMGDSSKGYVAGLPDFKMTANGFVDFEANDLFEAADGKDRTFFLYPDRDNQQHYWSGKINLDYSSEGGTTGAVKATLNGSAATGGVRKYYVPA